MLSVQIHLVIRQFCPCHCSHRVQPCFYPCVSTSPLSSFYPCVSTSPLSSFYPCVSTSPLSSFYPCVSTSPLSSFYPCVSTSALFPSLSLSRKSFCERAAAFPCQTCFSALQYSRPRSSCATSVLRNLRTRSRATSGLRNAEDSLSLSLAVIDVGSWPRLLEGQLSGLRGRYKYGCLSDFWDFWILDFVPFGLRLARDLSPNGFLAKTFEARNVSLRRRAQQ